jgi:hypothetical protein
VGTSEPLYTGREDLNLSVITAEPPGSLTLYSPGDNHHHHSPDLSIDIRKHIRQNPPKDDTFRDKPKSTLI